MPVALLAADNGVTLNFDFGLGYGQGGHGDEGAAGKIVAEYFPPELRKTIAVAHIGDEHGHLHHVAELAAGNSSAAPIRPAKMRDNAVETILVSML